MLTLSEQYIVEKFSDLWKPSDERAKKWVNKSLAKSGGKAAEKSLRTSLDSGKYEPVKLDMEKVSRRASRSAFVGRHVGQGVGAVGVPGLAGAAFLAYKQYKKYKAKEKEADTPEEKELFRKKAASAKAKSAKLKSKKG